jgi:DNA anti-recombination protein RmuC
VRQAVDNFRLERRSSEILEFLVEFKGEWNRFTEHLDKTGRQLETFQKSWESLGSTRRNQMERKLRRIDELEAEHDTKAELVPLVEPDSSAGGPDDGRSGRVAEAALFLPSVEEAS